MWKVGVLRGVNVSGKHRLNMSDFADALLQRGLEQVQTYIQSGNYVVYDPQNWLTPASLNEILLDLVGWQVANFVYTADAWLTITQHHALDEEAKGEIEKLYWVCAETDVSDLQVPEKWITQNEQWKLAKHGIYFYCPGSFGQTKLSNTAWEKLMSTQCTTRNWRTMLALRTILTRSMQAMR